MGRFVMSAAISVVAIAGHYDVLVGDYIDDRVLVACLIVQTFLAFPGERHA